MTPPCVRWRVPAILAVVIGAGSVRADEGRVPVQLVLAEDPPCATESIQEAWKGVAVRADQSDHPDDALATITWRRVHTSDCIDTYEPSGSVRARFVVPGALCVQSIQPSTQTIASADGTLEIDRNTNPPTYQGSGYTAWMSDWTCAHPDGHIDRLEVPLGGVWFAGFGAVEDARIAGQTRRESPECGPGASSHCVYAWGFDPEPDDHPLGVVR